MVQSLYSPEGALKEIEVRRNPRSQNKQIDTEGEARKR